MPDLENELKLAIIERDLEILNIRRGRPLSDEQHKNTQESTATYYRESIASIVGVPESRAFEYKESTGNIHRFEAPDGRRINIDSKGQFYDGELRPIDHEAGSSYQRMTAEEWKSHGYDNTRQLMRHLREFTQPSIDRFVQEEKLGGLEHASDTQQDRLRDTLKQHLGMGTEIASLAVVQQVLDRKYAVGMEPTQRENMEQEYLHDTLVGKEGPSYENAVREAKYASKMAAPVLADFSRENNVPIAQLTAEQIEQVSRAVSRQHGISLALARQQTDYLLIKEQENDLHRNVILERGVGPENTTHYTWKQNSGDIESYQHNTTGRYVHLDSNSYFYDTNRTPIDASAALSHAEQKQMIAPYNEYAVGSPNPAWDRETMNLQTLREGRTDHSLPTEQYSQAKEEGQKAQQRAVILDRGVEPKNAIEHEQVSEQTMPARIYASALEPGQLYHDIKLSRLMVGHGYSPEEVADKIASRQTDLHRRLSDEVAKEYAGNLVQHLYAKPMASIDEHIEDMKPTTNELRHWQPLVSAADFDLNANYLWKGEQSGVQHFHRLEQSLHLYVDVESQFFSREGTANRFEGIKGAEWIEDTKRSTVRARATDSWSSLAFAGYEVGIEQPLRDFNYVSDKNEVFTYQRDSGEMLYVQDHNEYAHRPIPGEGPIYRVSYYADPDGKTQISPKEALQQVAGKEIEHRRNMEHSNELQHSGPFLV